MAKLSKSKERIVIPAPVLPELLTAAPSLESVLEKINGFAVFVVSAFGTRAAYELAEMTRAAAEAGDKKQRTGAPWQKIKVDRQIVAIAKSVRCSRIYPDGGTQTTFAISAGLQVTHSWEKPLDPSAA